MRLFINFLLSTIAAFILILLFPAIGISEYGVALIIAIVLGLSNIVIKPLLKLFTAIPIFFTIILSLFIINCIVVVMADWILEGNASESTWSVIIFSSILAVINWGIHKLIWQKTC